MPYPNRKAWLFRNVHREFTFYPTLESIEITQEHPEMVATFRAKVVDGGEGWEFVEEDELRALADDERIFAGHLTSVTEDAASEFGPRVWWLEAQDFTAKLGDAVIRQREHRKAERAIRRIRWIVGYLGNAWHIDDHEYDVPDEDVERQDMFGMSVAEGLDSVINEVGLRPAWIDLDNKLWVVNAAHTTAAPFALDNEAPDFVTSFPFRQFAYRRDSIDRANAILVEPEKRADSQWSVAQANIDAYAWGDSTGRKELFISAEEIRTARAAQRHGDAVLQRRKTAEAEATLTCYEPGIWAGMSVALTEALWEHDQTMRVVRVVITAVDPHDTNGKAYFRCDLTLNNKPKRRSPKMGRAEAETANSGPYPVDDFDRVATPAEPTAGDTLVPALSLYRIEWMRGYAVFDPDTDEFVEVAPLEGPTIYPVRLGGGTAIDVAGIRNTPWTRVQCGGVGLGAMSGWLESESWFSFTVPTHPADMAGMYVEVAAVLQGAATLYGVHLRVRSSPPVALRTGTIIGTFGATPQTLLIPAALIPAAGQTIWVGVTPAWSAYHDITYFCLNDPPAYWDQNGQANTGIPGPYTWAISAATIDLGQTSSPEEAPWQGPWDWEVDGTSGGPTYGIDGEGFYAEDGEVTISLAGAGADPDAAYSPWAGVESDTIITFDVTGSGDGSITVATTGQGYKTSGTITVGTGEGIAVQGAIEGDATSKAIAVDTTRYIARFDSRSGDIRGKVWRASDGQPADWDVMADKGTTEDDDDRFALTVDAAAGQTIRILSIEMAAAAAEGERIVGEVLGRASGLTNRFYTDHKHRPGSLRFFVNGALTAPSGEDGDDAWGTTDIRPTADSAMKATYVRA